MSTPAHTDEKTEQVNAGTCEGCGTWSDPIYRTCEACRGRCVDAIALLTLRTQELAGLESGLRVANEAGNRLGHKLEAAESALTEARQERDRLRETVDKVAEWLACRRVLFATIIPIDERAKGGLDGRLSELSLLEQFVALPETETPE